MPTGRLAYQATRVWLLGRYGAQCAYCGTRHEAARMTLDHVTPRRGQTAYDRRDNLVLCCAGCNTAKADRPLLVWLLQQKPRATYLTFYGAHLSDGLRTLAAGLVDDTLLAKLTRLADPDYPYAD